MGAENQAVEAAKFLKSCQDEAVASIWGLIAPPDPNSIQFTGFVIREPGPLAATSMQSIEELTIGHWEIKFTLNRKETILKGKFSMRNPVDTMRKEIADSLMEQMRTMLAELIAPQFLNFKRT